MSIESEIPSIVALNKYKLPNNVLVNTPEVIEIILNCFYDFEGKFEENVVTCEIRELVFTEKCIEIFKKKTKIKYQCSKADMKPNHREVSIPKRELAKLIESNDPEAKIYNEENLYLVLTITVIEKDGERLSFPFDIFTQIRLACNRLEYEFSRHFKFMFYYEHPFYLDNIKIGIMTTKL